MNEYTYEVIPANPETFSQAIVKRTDSNGDVLWIPADPANSDYQAYLKSLETDNQ